MSPMPAGIRAPWWATTPGGARPCAGPLAALLPAMRWLGLMTMAWSWWRSPMGGCFPAPIAPNRWWPPCAGPPRRRGCSCIPAFNCKRLGPCQQGTTARVALPLNCGLPARRPGASPVRTAKPPRPPSWSWPRAATPAAGSWPPPWATTLCRRCRRCSPWPWRAIPCCNWRAW